MNHDQRRYEWRKRPAWTEHGALSDDAAREAYACETGGFWTRFYYTHIKPITDRFK